MDIIITSAAYDALLQHADAGGFRKTGRRLDDGRWLVPISDKTMERLQRIRFSGENWSDVIIRISAFAAQGGRTN